MHPADAYFLDSSLSVNYNYEKEFHIPAERSVNSSSYRNGLLNLTPFSGTEFEWECDFKLCSVAFVCNSSIFAQYLDQENDQTKCISLFCCLIEREEE
jgi:hypothetical protein